MPPSRYKCSNVDVHQIDNLVIKFYCDLEFDIEAELAKHLATHSLKAVDQKFECLFCKTLGKRTVFDQLVNAKRHLFNIHLKIKSFSCEMCNDRFADKNTLKIHNRIHTGEKLSCKICEFSTNTERTLKRHEACHYAIKPHKCKDCGKSFVQKSKLKEHENSHTKESIFMCKDCKREFTTKYNLERHNKTCFNMGFLDKPHKCDDCDFETKDESSLNRHKEKHSNQIIFVHCEYCSHKTRQKANMKKHVAKKHNQM